MLGRRSLTLAPVLAWLLGSSACGGEDQSTAPGSRAQAFKAVAIVTEDSCLDCWSQMAVTAEGVLTLEDGEGEERFELTASEAMEVRDIVLSEDFLAALEDKSCPPTFDASARLEVEWSDVGLQIDPSIAGCAGARYQRNEHPYGRLYWLIIDLKQSYFPCPKRDIVPLTPENMPDKDTPPPVRMLCYPCGGEC